MLEKMLKIEKKNNFSDKEAVCSRGHSESTHTETHSKLQLQFATHHTGASGYGKM